MLKRRDLFAVLAGLPLVGKLLGKPWLPKPLGAIPISIDVSTVPAQFAALMAVEKVAGDDFCFEIDILEHYGKLTPRERTMAQKLSLIYRIAHSHDQQAVCYSVHNDWRAEVQKVLSDEVGI